MNKLFSKVAALSVGLAMAIGVGVAVGSKEAKVASADTEESATVLVGDIASANSWANESQHSSWNLNSDISISTAGTGNNGKYYTSNSSWRLYEANNGALTLTGATDVTLSSVTFTYAKNNNGTLYKGNTNYASGTAITISGSSYSFDGVKHASGSKSGNIQITQIEIHYTKASSDTLNSINLAATSKGTTALESATVKTDKTLQVYLTANYSSAGAVDKTNDATWTVTNGTGAATVSKGLITGTEVGSVTISASYGGKSAVSLILTVEQGPKVTLSSSQVTPFHEKETKNDITVSTSGFSGTPVVTASSSSANVTASILANGNLQIVGGNSISANETVDVTVTANDGNEDAAAVCKVYLKAPVFTLSGSELNVKPGSSSSITVTTDFFMDDVVVTAPSDSPAVFTTSVNGSTITVNGLKEGSGSITVTATDGIITRSGTVSVNIADVLEYELITKDSDLTADSQLIIASTVNSSSFAMGAQSGTLRSSVSVTVANNKISGPSSDVKIVTLEGESDAWYLKVEDGYLNYSGGTSNAIATVAEKDEACSWSISISSNNATITPSTATSRFISYNSNQPRFCVYGSVQKEIQLYGILGEEKEIANTRLTTSGGSITASVGAAQWTVSGFVFEVQYEGESTWNVVSPTYTVTESVPSSYESIGEYPVHFKVTYKGVDYNVDTPFTAVVTDDATPISEFYTALDTTKTYKYRGTVIGIEGNSYYLQQGDYGILVYGGSTTPPEGMKIGDLVQLTSKVQNYKGYVIENSGGADTATILGTGSLPAAPIVTTVEGFNAHNQSTRVTFNGLLRNDDEESITWESTWSSKSTDAKAVVKDSTNATIKLVVSRYLDSDVATAIINKINTIKTVDTFDLFQGVKVVSTSDGSSTLSVMTAESITIHTPEEDHIQTWIDQYMQMNNPDFEGDGTGACKDSNYYVNAKAGLKAVEEAHPGSIDEFREDSEGKYAAALERYLAWAVACNDAEPFDGNDSILTHLRSIEFSSFESNPTIVIVIVIAAASALAFTTLLVFKKKKQK